MTCSPHHSAPDVVDWSCLVKHYGALSPTGWDTRFGEQAWQQTMMSVTDIAIYLLRAALYGAALTGILALIVPRVRRTPALVFLCTFLVFLAFHPFPDPAVLDCAHAPQPRWEPFQFLEPLRALWARGAPAIAYISDKTVASSAMNLALCMAIGSRLPAQGIGVGGALLFGAALSFGIELTQLTGIYGFYPCPYRTFDVDDLILNIGGIVLGAAMMGLRRRAL